MTSVLGVSCHFHDSAAVLVRDGEVVLAIEEERLSRVKHDSSFPAMALDACVAAASEPIDAVVFYERPDAKLRRSLRFGFRGLPTSGAGLRELGVRWARDRAWLEHDLVRSTGVHPKRIHYIGHHLAHAASAAYTRPERQGNWGLLTIDGVGETATSTIGRLSSSGVPEIESETVYPHSLGLLYSVFTQFLGFEVNEGEFKVMGLAAYGSPSRADAIRDMVKVSSDGTLQLDMRYFQFDRSVIQGWTASFEKALGIGARGADVPYFTGGFADDQAYADIAASVQLVCEEVVLSIARSVSRQTGATNVCYAGGVALNGLANSRVLLESGIQNLHIPPAPGDSGGALGAALYGYHAILRAGPYVAGEGIDPYLGNQYSALEATRVASSYGFHTQTVGDDDELVSSVARLLEGGKVIGWCQGRDEFGPRALGNRSILADPRPAAMKAKINDKVKYREQFRPFAPAMLRDGAMEAFSSKLVDQQSAKYMLFVAEATDEAAQLMPATTHRGTSRFQVVDANWNPRFAQLVSAFGERTGCSALLNTSFNRRGEPIVSSPSDALRTFAGCDLDAVVIGDSIVQKS